MQSNFKCPCLNHHNFLLKMIKFYLEQWQLFGFLVEISNLWKLFETNWVELNVKWHHPKHEYQKSINFYNYFIYPNRHHTCKTNAVVLTSLNKCQHYCIGKCRCYDLYTTPICNVWLNWLFDTLVLLYYSQLFSCARFYDLNNLYYRLFFIFFICMGQIC